MGVEAEESTLEALAQGRLVMGVGEDGDMWVGNVFAFFRVGHPQETSDQGVAKVTAIEDPVNLTPCLYDGHQMLIVDNTARTLRVFERPDGETVWVNDDFCSLIERTLNAPVMWAQAGADPLGVVGASISGMARLDAVVMPVRRQ